MGLKRSLKTREMGFIRTTFTISLFWYRRGCLSNDIMSSIAATRERKDVTNTGENTVSGGKRIEFTG